MFKKIIEKAIDVPMMDIYNITNIIHEHIAFKIYKLDIKKFIKMDYDDVWFCQDGIIIARNNEEAYQEYCNFIDAISQEYNEADGYCNDYNKIPKENFMECIKEGFKIFYKSEPEIYYMNINDSVGDDNDEYRSSYFEWNYTYKKPNKNVIRKNLLREYKDYFYDFYNIEIEKEAANIMNALNW